METKRIILALVLSFAVFFGWQLLFPQQRPQQPAEQTTASTAEQPAQQATSAAPAATAPEAALSADIAPIEATEGRDITVKTPLYTARFNTQGGLLESFSLHDYFLSVPVDGQPLPDQINMISGGASLGLLVDGARTWENAQWDTEVKNLELEQGSGTVIFHGRIEGYDIERIMTFEADSYSITEEVRIISTDASSADLRITHQAATNALAELSGTYNPAKIVWQLDGSLDDETDQDDLRTDGLQPVSNPTWSAIDNNYFILAMQPSGNSLLEGGMTGDTFFMNLSTGTGSIRPGESRSIAMKYFIGPMDRDQLIAASPELGQAVNFGWFDFIAKPMLLFLVWLHQYVGNWGVAIIILTVIIKLIFWPLSQRSYKSMEQMKKIQPMVQKLREKYKDDKQRLNQETMQLYKTYKVNPAGGCLPMVVQIPVFFGLYKALLGAIELRHAGFIDTLPFTDMVWLADLSAKDPFYITPLVMGATMFLQQLMTPTAGDPTQKKIMYIMPVVFTFLFLQFPAGLVVYWLCNNVLSIAQQWWIAQSGKKGKAA
ncbi:YidC/Oxa1 family membrane protein insertase [Paucidesulfovibrio gracilis DSM 16080]|uniref:Membrane protein insertase YidC n=1 Tax=Paucidesulfovibrio gracilis DSM 16080 TaxID=1121449 RepID=A0A1T4W3K3_9BACT|nr:membrane protein insertase YidC [Paucidesulfovibrio gracilis]SKA71729.1 YidC/Oxa1 family membrane protein insertase [Paucidesulfovibrio gracilis DSM 16080]